MKWAIRIYGFCLAVYMGFRTFDFMSAQIPADMGIDIKFWLPLLFILSTEIGLLLWNEATSRCTSSAQFNLANVMLWLDFAGSVLAGIADMIIRQTMLADYTIPRPMAMTLMVGMPVLTALNIGGAILFGQLDFEQRIALQHAQISWMAYQEAFKDARKRRKTLAATKKTAIMDQLQEEADDIETIMQPKARAIPVAPTLQPPVMPIADVPLMAHTETPTVTAGGNGRTSRNSSSANPTLARRRSQ
jgi:hypothetical protein